MKEKLFRLIKRKEFRRWALPSDAEPRIRRAIDLCSEKNRPLNFVFEFGGYKLWRLPSAPYADLAEEFMLRHYINYLKPIAEAYEPGVNLYFASDDCVVERMNNIKADAMEKYASSFVESIKKVSFLLPQNMTVSYVRLAELYQTRDVFEAELASAFSEQMEKYNDWTPEKKERMAKRAALNFCTSGPLAATDLSGISDEEYQQRLREGAVYHDAFEDCEQRKKFVVGEDRILLFCTPIPEAVAIGTTKYSVTKFWTGVGIQEDGKEKVLSPSQWRERNEAGHFGENKTQSSL